nr:MAG TPA: hypothetical protein [Caudoviricetes sp.]
MGSYRKIDSDKTREVCQAGINFGCTGLVRSLETVKSSYLFPQGKN